MSLDRIFPEEVDTHAIAKLLGISPRSVRDWAGRGVLVRGSKAGKYKTVPSIHAYRDHLLGGKDPNDLFPADHPTEPDDAHMKRLIKETLAELGVESKPARGGRRKKSGVTGND